MFKVSYSTVKPIDLFTAAKSINELLPESTSDQNVQFPLLFSNGVFDANLHDEENINKPVQFRFHHFDK